MSQDRGRFALAGDNQLGMLQSKDFEGCQTLDARSKTNSDGFRSKVGMIVIIPHGGEQLLNKINPYPYIRHILGPLSLSLSPSHSPNSSPTGGCFSIETCLKTHETRRNSVVAISSG